MNSSELAINVGESGVNYKEMDKTKQWEIIQMVLESSGYKIVRDIGERKMPQVLDGITIARIFIDESGLHSDQEFNGMYGSEMLKIMLILRYWQKLVDKWSFSNILGEKKID